MPFANSASSLTPTVVWIGKALGCLLFEPLVSRIGYKKVMYIVLVIQTVGVIGEVWPAYDEALSQAIMR
jgi:MFS family permease